MPGITSLAYTDIKADDSAPKNQATVDLCGTDPNETRWWLAVLAPTEVWKATMSLGQDTFFAPWSVQLQSGSPFLLSTNRAPGTHSAAPPSSSKALGFLDNFCTRQNLSHQSQAALAAVLLFPTMAATREEFTLCC